MKKSPNGFIAPLLLGIIAILLVGGGVYVYVERQNGNNNPPTGLPPLAAQATSTGLMATPLRFHYADTPNGVSLQAEAPTFAAIQKDAGSTYRPAELLYENKDRIYFTVDEGKDTCYTILDYLDKKSLLYYTTGVGACSPVSFEKTKPYLIEELHFTNFSVDNPSLNAVNLDTGRRVELYKPTPEESLFAGAGGNYGQSFSDIEITSPTVLKVGIFKRYKLYSDVPTDSNDDQHAEKIRDQIVTLP